MTEAKKFTEEELKQVKQIQDKYFDIQNQFGLASITKLRLEKQMDNLMQQKEDLAKSFTEIQENERKFLDEITKKYGQGTLNPETGEFVPNKSE